MLSLYYYSGQKIKSNIENIIKKEVPKFEKYFIKVNFDTKDISYFDFIDRVKKRAMNSDVLLVNVYDENKKALFNIETVPLSNALLHHIRSLDMISTYTNYLLIPTDSKDIYLYLQTKVNANSKAYYINIVMKLDEQTAIILSNELLRSLSMIFFIIFVVVIFTFPIIYSQYKILILQKKELLGSNVDMLISLGSAMAKRDSETSEHNYRVTYYSVKLAAQLHLSDAETKALIKGAFLHDIGKIAISDTILLKPSKLTNEEFEIMKTHTVHGVEIVGEALWLSDAKDVILYHHEKVDGSGYPYSLKGDDIPYIAKVFAVCDVFDALTSKRPYKTAFSVEQSIQMIYDNAEMQFDKKIVEVFILNCEELFSKLENRTENELKAILYEEVKSYF
jgi:putative nucleotidyltransferase with HDIG domain